MDGPDFSKYNLDQLYDSLNHIDKNRFPDRVKIIETLIIEKGGKIENEIYQESNAGWFEIKQEKSIQSQVQNTMVTIEKPNGEKIQKQLATRIKRLGAAILDALLLIIPLIIIYLMFFYSVDQYPKINFKEQILFLLIFHLVYLSLNGYLLWKYGQTIGKKIVGTRIVNLDGDVPPFIRLYLMRYVSISFINILPVVGIIFSFVNILFIFRNDLRCVHDHFAGTRVILV